jgi:hypothetical protein
MPTYKKINNLETNEMCGILKDDRHSIPLNPANKDYQEYLEWVAEGNTPEEAE